MNSSFMNLYSLITTQRDGSLSGICSLVFTQSRWRLCLHNDLRMELQETATFTVTAAKLESARCLSASDWINKLWSRQTMQYRSQLKRNRPSNPEETWRKVRCGWLSEEVNPKRVCAIWFQHSQMVWEKVKAAGDIKKKGCICQRSQGRREERGTENFQGSENDSDLYH